jgi:hypothetical protein
LVHVHQTLFFDTQLVMLSAAAQRDDRSLTPPEKLKGGAALEGRGEADRG